MTAVELSPLLSPEESTRATALLAWSCQERGAIATIFRNIALEWASQWGIKDQTLENARTTKFQVALASAIPYVIEVAQQDLMAMSVNPDQPSNCDISNLIVEKALFGPRGSRIYTSNENIVSKTVAEEALADWYSRILTACGTSTSTPPRNSSTQNPDNPENKYSQWNGDLRIELPWCGTSVAVTVSGETVKNMIASSKLPIEDKSATQTFSLSEALQEHSLPLTLKLSGTQLTLGQISGLEVGDVVTLDHLVSDPLSITNAGSEVMLEGWLGQIQQHRAVELVRQGSDYSN